MIDAFIDRHRHLVRGISGRGLQRPRVQTSGSHYDLSVVFERLNERFFEGRVDAAITWATVPKVRGRRKSIRLGSYSERTGTVRVHPALDHPLVPPYFLEWIVFHELLHVIEGARPRKGRRLVHTSEFKRREEAFPELERARRWERENIDWLLGWQPQ